MDNRVDEGPVPKARRGIRTAVQIGVATGIASASTSVVVLISLHLLLPSGLWGASAAAFLGTLSAPALFLVAVIVGPLYETLLGQILPIEIARRLGANAVGCIALSAAAFGIGHYLNGGLAHGVTALISGGFFAWAYVSMRDGRLSTAATAAFSAHAMHNALLLFVAAPLFPQLA